MFAYKEVSNIILDECVNKLPSKDLKDYKDISINEYDDLLFMCVIKSLISI